jgi:hypothetical protein
MKVIPETIIKIMYLDISTAILNCLIAGGNTQRRKTKHLNRGRVDKYKMSYSIFLKTTCKNLNLYHTSDLCGDMIF